ncbi:MAG TPA: nitrite reductase (NAD(P)H) small subunit, partial [Thiotrichales bacterium]|nr:nitrite reductase (NAD(P)H) small subunit [Thiotrichales bacterium]
MQAEAREEAGWLEVGPIDEIPRQGARVVRTPDGDIAVFRTLEDEIFALRD